MSAVYSTEGGGYGGSYRKVSSGESSGRLPAWAGVGWSATKLFFLTGGRPFQDISSREAVCCNSVPIASQ